MPSSRIPSPARSQGVISTPRKHTPRRSRSVCSAKSNKSLRLTSVIADSFKLSPMPNRQSVLNDDTYIEAPGRKSWWKKLGENSRDVMEVLETKDIGEVNNVAEEFDVEILSQEKKNYTIDLPESSDGESINSIVIPQRKLFTQKDNQAQKKFGDIIDKRETLAKLQKSHFDQEKDINVGPKNLFNQAAKPRTKPAFPAGLLNISSRAVNKTKEMPAVEVKGQVRNLFGNRPGTKRKNMFADFIVSDSEEEIPDIQPKVFGFQNNKGQKRRESSASRGAGHSPTSSIDLELDEWKLLPSSTMVENQLEEATTPVKRPRLSKLSEAKESETTNINSTVNKTKLSNKSLNSKNKSKSSSNSKSKQNTDEDLNLVSKTKEDVIVSKNNESLNNSNSIRVTRNKSKSMSENSLKESNDVNNSKQNKSKNALHSKENISVKAVHEIDKSIKHTEEIMETKSIQNKDENEPTEQVPADDDEDFTLEYENDDEQINEVTITENIIKENSIQLSKKNNNTNNKSLKDLNAVNTTIDHSNTEKFKASTVTNEETQEKQKNNSEPNNISKHNETDIQHKQKLNQSINKNSDNVENNSLLEQKKLNESQNTRQQKLNSSSARNKSLRSENVNNLSQKNTQNNSKLKDNHLEKSAEDEKRCAYNENEAQNESVHMDDIEKNQSKSSHSSSHEQEVSNKSIAAEESKGVNVIEENDQTHVDESAETEREDEDEADENEIVEQNESAEIEQEDEKEANESEIVEQNDTAEVEQEDEANESEVIEQNESAEIEQDENEANESEIVEQNDNAEVEQEDEANESEVDEQNESAVIEQNDEDQPDENKSENMNSDHEGNNESNSNQDESEVQQSEEIESDEEEDEEHQSEEVEPDEEENESEVDEENETENQYESENAESENEEQNDRNLSQNENELIESNQEQSDNDIEGNEVAEDQIVSNESSNDHDTTGRHRKKDTTNVKSPEAILHDKTNQIESFTAQGRNTSIRKTKSIIRHLNIRPSLAPVRESTGLSDGARDSSAEGSGWDSHRTTRKTIRLTLGKDFTPRKSLRALVMEKSAKRNTNYNDVIADTTKVPQANSTELPAFDSYQDNEPMQVDETFEEPSNHEVSARTRQTTLETYLQKIKQENLERKRKMQEEIKASLKAPTRDTFNTFKVPLKPVRRLKPVQNKSKPKQVKSSVIPLDMLPSEVLEDMKYKPPKRFQPSNASWITKRLYKFLETKLEPKYDYKARVRAERLVELLYSFTREARRGPAEHAVDTLKKEMARLDVVKTHFDFYQFFHDFMPREIRVKVVPDVVNKLSLPKNGVFSDIIQ